MKNKLILSIFFVLFLNLVIVQSQNEGLNLVYDIRENAKWLNGESLTFDLEENSKVIFNSNDVEENCEIFVVSVKKTTKTALLSLSCDFLEEQPILLRKDSVKEVDLDYDDSTDVNFLISNFDRKLDIFTLIISKSVPEVEKKSNPVTVIITIMIMIALIFFYYASRKKASNNYNKIKELLEQLENYLSLKQHENAKNAYTEVKSLYKGLTLGQQNELYDKINELFKQYEGEEKKNL